MEVFSPRGETDQAPTRKVEGNSEVSFEPLKVANPRNIKYFTILDVYLYMGQKDQDGDNAEKCHIFFNFGV